ncbi:MAG: hypothetical protein ACRDM0_18460 [Thermoleophilaceae bacterium]
MVPWVLGGIDPSREDLTWAILIAYALGLASLFTLVLSVFDLAGTNSDLAPTASQ